MARTKISEFSATPGDNTDIDGIDIAEGCAPSGINNAIRELMAQLKDMQTGASGDTFTLTTVNSTTVDTTNLEATNLKAKDGTAAGSIANSTGVVTLGSSVLTTTDINGGTVDGTTIGATTPSTVVATQVDIAAQGDLRLQDTTGGQYVALQAPGTVATSYTLTLPVDDGTAGQALITDGSGVLSWSTAASGDVYGPASATDNAVARYDGTTGKIIQNSAVTIGDDGATVIAANSASDGLRITQIGAGNALTVEDSANPDSSPFVIDAAGSVITGYTQSQTIAGAAYQYQMNGANPFGAIRWNSSNSLGLTALLGRSRSGTTGVNSIVVANDVLGTLTWAGDDGTAFIQAASISSAVDGTPGTNDMPGRLVFSTTADGASSPTERMRIGSAGTVGIGAANIAAATLYLNKTLTGGTTTYGVLQSGQVQSDVTTVNYGYLAQLNTQATAFTLENQRYFTATQGTIGAGSTVTTQAGFFASSNLTGATTNYGFYSELASGTGRWNFYAAGTAANYFAGNVAVGTTTTSIAKLYVSAGNIATDQSVLSRVSSALANGSRGFRGLIDGTEYFALYSDNTNTVLSASGTTRINVINSSGVISLGAAPGAESLRVTPVASAVNYVEIRGQATTGSPQIYAKGSDTNILLEYYSKGTGNHLFYTNGEFPARALQFAIAHTASAVNYIQAQGNSAGTSPYFIAQGSDTNVGMLLSTKGTGNVGFYSSAFSSLQFNIAHTASAVNYITVSGNSTGGAPSLYVDGSDTNVDLFLGGKGTGVLKFGTYTAGVVAQAGYITIKDAGGTTRRLLVG